MVRPDLENDQSAITTKCDQDAELAELAALIESGEASAEELERMAKLLGGWQRGIR